MLEEKVILELSKDEAAEIAVALAFSVHATLEDFGKEDEVTKSIERSGRILNEVLKLFPEIMDNPMFPSDFWEKFELYREHPSGLRRLGEKEMQNALRGKEKIEEVPSEIKEKSAETLAEEIIELARKEYPESLNKRYIPNEVFELFWNSKGVSRGELSMYEIQDPAIRLKMMRAETLAEELKVPEEEKRKIITTEEINEKEAFLELKEKSAETLAEEIIELARKEYPESLNEQYIPNEILKLFWNSKGILPNYDIQDPAIRIKMERAEALATKGKHKEEFNIFVTGATNVEIKDALQFLEEFRKKIRGGNS